MSDSPGNKVVWMINQYTITPDLPGGTRHFDFGCELVKRGYDVCIFASDVNLALRKHMKLQPGELWREEEVEGVRFIWTRAALYEKNNWRRAWNMLSFSWNVQRVAREIKDRPDVIIGSSPHPFAAQAAWHVSRRLRSRFLLEIRDLWPQTLIDMGGISERGLVTGGLRMVERQLYSAADKIIVLAKGSYQHLVGRGIDPNKLVYIPNGVHLSNFQIGCPDNVQQKKEEFRKEFGFEGFTIVYTGAHGPANSLGTILAAADILNKQCSDIKFVLVGDGPSKKDLVRDAYERGLTNIRFMDPIPKESIPKLLCAADAAVITLRAVDTFSYGVSPNKLFDYMAAGKPIICAVPGDMAELVNSSEAGISVEPEDADALGNAAKQMSLMTKEELNAIGQRGRQLVRSEFSREVLADQLISIL